MGRVLLLRPVEMTAGIMSDLEGLGLIIRLCPGHHELPVKDGETRDESIYESFPSYGPHKLITVTVNDSSLSAFGSHPDNEEFLFIGEMETKPLFFVVARVMKDELAERIADGSVSEKDFTCLRVTYNDANVSFFTMLANVPHGEVVGVSEKKPPSFYVTEPRDMGIELTEFAGVELRLAPE